MMEKLYYKVSRDPVHSEIFLYPLEIIFSDTSYMQRLRYLSQLAGAEYVYPSATHTRFSHSLGVMHIAGLYSKKIYPNNHSKFRILRLAGFVHDIGHGPYSHQFDDVVYKKMGYEDGHDEFREKIISYKMIDEIIKVYDGINDSRIKKDIIKDLSLTLEKDIDENNLKEHFQELLEKIKEVFKGEFKGNIDFNIVQGPLGADRMDFILRDSYFAGTRHFGTGAVDRIIRNAELFDDGKICYSIKVIDDIYSSLFARFMMYKNVYFHKTSRAADQMLQEILKIAYDVLGLPNRVEDLDEFIKLTDQRIIDELEVLYDSIYRKNTKFSLTESMKNIEKLEYAHTVIDRLRKRDLWKMIKELPFSTTGVDPSIISISVAEDFLKKLNENIKKVQKTDIDKNDKEQLCYILENFENIFKIDTPYKLSLVHPKEFLYSDVFIKDLSGEVLDFEEVYTKYPAYKFMQSNLLQIVRIYMKEDKREILKKYKLIPENNGTKVTTRW
jgi:hypothetical protein